MVFNGEAAEFGYNSSVVIFVLSQIDMAHLGCGGADRFALNSPKSGAGNNLGLVPFFTLVSLITLNLNKQCSPRCRACWLHKQHTKRAPRQEEEEEHKPTAACRTFLP